MINRGVSRSTWRFAQARFSVLFLPSKKRRLWFALLLSWHGSPLTSKSSGTIEGQ